MSELGRRLARELERATLERLQDDGPRNAAVNRPRMQRSVMALRDAPLGAGDSALVIGAGPSLRPRGKPALLDRLRAAAYPGTIVAADGALGACLRAGVVPHLLVSVDPHPGRIVRWFGDPALTARPADDYFRRQEMDPAHAQDELAANRELLALVDRHGPAMRLAAATSAAPAVVERALQAGLTLYWWNPMYDDPDRPDSLTGRLFRDNGLPCINGGGNVGSAAWVLAHAVLAKRRIGLLGIDFGYAPDTPYEKTQYYPELKEMLGDRFKEAFVQVPNPAGEAWFCDPAYYWFRDVFLEMAREAECVTVNCTEGGILAGDGIGVGTLEEFVAA